MESGNVRADGQLNLKFGCMFFRRVVFRQPSSDLTSLYANDRIVAGIVGRGAMKQVYPNRTLFQILGVTGEDLLDDLGENFLRAGAIVECMAVLNLRQLAPNVVTPIPARIRKSRRFLS